MFPWTSAELPLEARQHISLVCILRAMKEEAVCGPFQRDQESFLPKRGCLIKKKLKRYLWIQKQRGLPSVAHHCLTGAIAHLERGTTIYLQWGVILWGVILWGVIKYHARKSALNPSKPREYQHQTVIQRAK